MKEITSQQQRVLDCIQIYLKKTGFPPTRADICKELGFNLQIQLKLILEHLKRKDLFQLKVELLEVSPLTIKTIHLVEMSIQLLA